jgi:sulfite reductase alpha subunit-like flavoprotein
MEEDATAHVSVVAAASGVVLVASLALLIYRFSSHGDTVSEVAPSRSAPAQSTNGGVEDVKSAAAQVLVLYGTQTGTAERFAKKIGAEVSSRFSEQAHVHLADIEDFDFKAETPKVRVSALSRGNHCFQSARHCLFMPRGKVC